MAKFKLVIEADIELGPEESAEYAAISETERKRYTQSVIDGMHGVVEGEMASDMKYTINVSYVEATK